MTQAHAYIPPYLKHNETSEIVFFNAQMAKNPRLVPYWDIPADTLYEGMSTQDMRTAHARAVAAVAKLHITERVLSDINDVRVKQAESLGFESEPILIGTDPTVRAGRRPPPVSERRLEIRPIPIDGSVDTAAIDGLITVSESVSSPGGPRGRMRRAASALASE